MKDTTPVSVVACETPTAVIESNCVVPHFADSVIRTRWNEVAACASHVRESRIPMAMTRQVAIGFLGALRKEQGQRNECLAQAKKTCACFHGSGARVFSRPA